MRVCEAVIRLSLKVLVRPQLVVQVCKRCVLVVRVPGFLVLNSNRAVVPRNIKFLRVQGFRSTAGVNLWLVFYRPSKFTVGYHLTGQNSRWSIRGLTDELTGSPLLRHRSGDWGHVMERRRSEFGRSFGWLVQVSAFLRTSISATLGFRRRLAWHPRHLDHLPLLLLLEELSQWRLRATSIDFLVLSINRLLFPNSFSGAVPVLQLPR